MLVSSVLSAAVSGFVVNNIVSKSYQEKLSILGAQTEEVVATPEPQLTTPDYTPESAPLRPFDSAQGFEGQGGQYIVVVGDTPTGFLRVRETPNGKEIAKVNVGDKLPFLDENSGWYKVTLESGDTGWISKEYSSKE
jgi:uncharacterized protein YgiM (DUF1202 family)